MFVSPERPVPHSAFRTPRFMGPQLSTFNYQPSGRDTNFTNGHESGRNPTQSARTAETQGKVPGAFNRANRQLSTLNHQLSARRHEFHGWNCRRSNRRQRSKSPRDSSPSSPASPSHACKSASWPRPGGTSHEGHEGHQGHEGLKVFRKSRFWFPFVLRALRVLRGCPWSVASSRRRYCGRHLVRVSLRVSPRHSLPHWEFSDSSCFFHLEDGQGVDFPVPEFQAWAAVFTNIITITALATLPVWLLSWRRHRHDHTTA